MIGKGLEHARGFTWRRCGEIHLAAFEEAAARWRVGLDLSPLVQTRAGTARYVTGLAQELERLPGIELRRLTFGGPGRAAALARDTLWYGALLPLRARGLDVLHCTTFRAPFRASVPVVVTVHDLAVLRHPELFTAWTRLYARTALGPVLRAAARVVAVSEFTKREVVELACVPEERVRVVPNATADVFRVDGPRADGDYVLALGTLEPRKNLRRLIEATRRLGVELRVVGDPGWGGVEVGGDGVRWLGFLPDEEVAAQLRGARVFAYPSLYEEGLSIPVLEALHCGAPVVTSAASPMAEIADGAAELVDPLDVASIAAGIERAGARRNEPGAAARPGARGRLLVACLSRGDGGRLPGARVTGRCGRRAGEKGQTLVMSGRATADGGRTAAWSGEGRMGPVPIGREKGQTLVIGVRTGPFGDAAARGDRRRRAWAAAHRGRDIRRRPAAPPACPRGRAPARGGDAASTPGAGPARGDRGRADRPGPQAARRVRRRRRPGDGVR